MAVSLISSDYYETNNELIEKYYGGNTAFKISMEN